MTFVVGFTAGTHAANRLLMICCVYYPCMCAVVDLRENPKAEEDDRLDAGECERCSDESPRASDGLPHPGHGEQHLQAI